MNIDGLTIDDGSIKIHSKDFPAPCSIQLHHLVMTFTVRHGKIQHF